MLHLLVGSQGYCKHPWLEAGVRFLGFQSDVCSSQLLFPSLHFPGSSVISAHNCKYSYTRNSRAVGLSGCKGNWFIFWSDFDTFGHLCTNSPGFYLEFKLHLYIKKPFSFLQGLKMKQIQPYMIKRTLHTVCGLLLFALDLIGQGANRWSWSNSHTKTKRKFKIKSFEVCYCAVRKVFH